jgi:hypothetical protein
MVMYNRASVYTPSTKKATVVILIDFYLTAETTAA